MSHPLAGLPVVDKLQERVQQATVFAIGLSVESSPPFAVMKVRDLQTPNRRSLADKVQASDRLCSINGTPIEERLAPGLPIESVIFGRLLSLPPLLLPPIALISLFLVRTKPARISSGPAFITSTRAHRK